MKDAFQRSSFTNQAALIHLDRRLLFSCGGNPVGSFIPHALEDFGMLSFLA